MVSALVMAMLFQQAALRRFDQGLAELIDNLVAGSTPRADGGVAAPALTDLRALRAYSGKYWQIARPTPDKGLRILVRSRSLWDSELKGPPDLVLRLAANPGQAVSYDTRGPMSRAGQGAGVTGQAAGKLRAIDLHGREDRTGLNRDIRSFTTATAAVLLLLGAGLIAAVVVQVRVGLNPLFALRREIAEVRRGKSERILGAYPTELTPLAEELNALMAHNQDVVERQRTHVGNLAHALKTPLSVMLTEAEQQPGDLAGVVTRQAEAMRRQVDHHLRRARAAARTQGLGERTSVAEVLDELSRTLGRIHATKPMAIDWDADEDLFFLGERQDLLELAGNAMENACKWGHSRVRVRSIANSDEQMTLTVEDDGPGLTPDQMSAVLPRAPGWMNPHPDPVWVLTSLTNWRVPMAAV